MCGNIYDIYRVGDFEVTEAISKADGTHYFVYWHVPSGTIQTLYVAQDLVSDIRNMLKAGVS